MGSHIPLLCVHDLRWTLLCPKVPQSEKSLWQPIACDKRNALICNALKCNAFRCNAVINKSIKFSYMIIKENSWTLKCIKTQKEQKWHSFSCIVIFLEINYAFSNVTHPLPVSSSMLTLLLSLQFPENLSELINVAFLFIHLSVLHLSANLSFMHTFKFVPHFITARNTLQIGLRSPLGHSLPRA